jgi:AraC family transcriptional regulator
MAHETTVRPGLRRLPYGAYFGASHVNQQVPGFSVSLLTPTLQAEDVTLHNHDNVSFVFVLSGAYASSADGAAPISADPVLIYNPAGVVHRDSFVLANGHFLAVSISAQSLRVALDWAALPSAARAYSSGAGFETAFALAQHCATPGPTSSSIMEAMCWELLSTVSGVCLWPERQTNLPS